MSLAGDVIFGAVDAGTSRNGTSEVLGMGRGRLRDEGSHGSSGQRCSSFFGAQCVDIAKSCVAGGRDVVSLSSAEMGRWSDGVMG